MAGANLQRHLPIIQVKNMADTSPYSSSMPEKAGQTFISGAPVQLFSSGFVQEYDGLTVPPATCILGVSESFGLNLGSDGLGAPTMPFGQITGTGAIASYGSVPNQPLAVNVALGTPISDGRTLYIEPTPDNIFEAMFDNSAGSVAADYTPTQALIGTNYGLTKSATSGTWYVDKNKTGSGALVQYIGVNPLYGFTINAVVRFRFLPAAVQIY